MNTPELKVFAGNNQIRTLEQLNFYCTVHDYVEVLCKQDDKDKKDNIGRFMTRLEWEDFR